MAETKGITISFYGNTVNFDKSVDGINNALKKTQNELKEVNKALKFDPQNAEKLQRQFELLSQKQRLLVDSIDTYKQELAKLGEYNDLNEDQKKQWEALQKNIASAEAELQKVNKQLSYLEGKDLRTLTKQMDDIAKNLNKVGSTVEGIGKKFAILSGTITGLATAGIQYNAELEKQTALFTGLTGSVEEAEKILSQIKENAVKSPFDVKSLISANQYLMASGIEAQKSTQTINALGNAIASTGGGNSELERMAQNLQQIQNVGKASTMDLRQFAMAGIDIWGILSESTGKTVAQLQKMTITYDMISEALTKASDVGGRYAGGMEAQAETLNGKLSKLKSTFQELLGQLTETLMPVIKEVLDYLQQWVDNLKALDDEQKKTIVKIAGMVAVISPLLIIIGKIITSVGTLVTFVSGILKNTAIANYINTFIAGGGNLITIITQILVVLEKIINPISVITTAVAILYATNEKFRKSVNDTAKTIKSSLMPIFNKIKDVVSQVVKSFTNLATTIKNLLEPVFSSIIDLLSSFVRLIGSIASVVISILSPAINGIISIFGGLISTVVNVVSALLSKLQPAFDLIAKVVQLVSNYLTILANNIKTYTKPAFDLMSSVVQRVVNDFKEIITWIQKLFDKLANTTFGQAFINVVNTIKGALDGLLNVIGNVLGWLDNLIAKTNTTIALQNGLSTGGRPGGRQTDMMNSGGLGLTMNIHVDNNGTPIDETEINRWVDIMTDRFDLALGRRL